ncbi:MAG: phosphoadenylyl-sulfate reductase [Flavobacteriaceae bacterium]|nr:phosphoadenylyl-sulfate reductase [Flavobacteriaceae bacterium]NNK73194.1 phosphoadenylyl-sulfate reductase [Flavobacteriaceae bacterium]
MNSVLTEKEIRDLNHNYIKLEPIKRIEQLYTDFNIDEIMLTSSFAATSALFLKLVSEVCPQQTVYFIDTGYHFKETINYVTELSRLYNLNVKSVKALKEEHKFTSTDKTWKKNPDYCCHINKVKPLDLIKKNYSVWMSGLMKWQSDHRDTLNIFETRGEILKFYPLLDITKNERDAIIAKQKLPFHPLVAKGYHSIGCSHCTVPGEDRSGRWNNNPKTECGLHL